MHLGNALECHFVERCVKIALNKFWKIPSELL